MNPELLAWIQTIGSIAIVPMAGVMWAMQQRMSKMEGQLEMVISMLYRDH